MKEPKSSTMPAITLSPDAVVAGMQIANVILAVVYGVTPYPPSRAK